MILCPPSRCPRTDTTGGIVTRLNLGGAYDGMDSRAETLFEQIGQEKRRHLDDDDDLAQARRAEALAVWHQELAELFIRAEELVTTDDGHPLEATMARQAALLHSSLAKSQARLAGQHRTRTERHRRAGIAAVLANPFSVERVHAAAQKVRAGG